MVGLIPTVLGCVLFSVGGLMWEGGIVDWLRSKDLRDDLDLLYTTCMR